MRLITTKVELTDTLSHAILQRTYVLRHLSMSPYFAQHQHPIQPPARPLPQPSPRPSVRTDSRLGAQEVVQNQLRITERGLASRQPDIVLCYIPHYPRFSPREGALTPPPLRRGPLRFGEGPGEGASLN
jgi:hypothetical protein